MKYREPMNSRYWHMVVELNNQEWPPIDPEGAWINRPIRQWVQDNCQDQIFFAHDGQIYFQSMSDFTLYVKRYSKF